MSCILEPHLFKPRLLLPIFLDRLILHTFWVILHLHLLRVKLIVYKSRWSLPVLFRLQILFAFLFFDIVLLRLLNPALKQLFRFWCLQFLYTSD